MSSSDAVLYKALRALASSDVLPMHMPGHKRSERYAELGSAFDITEINGFDDLHDPHGIIKALEDRAALLWGAKRSHILVGGSTCGILAAVYAMTHRGDKIIMARGCHKSVYHAVELCGLEVIYVSSPVDKKTWISGSISPADIKTAIAENPDAALVIVTSPTYEGIISDIAEIARFTHEANIPLMVDEAHGAHLGMGGFADGAVKNGADIVVQSLHKTLSCLTQTAVIHICSSRVSDAAISHSLDVFETSSPSYLLMASVDKCISEVCNEGIAEWHNAAFAIAEKLEKMNNLQLHNMSSAPIAFGADISKFTVLTNGKLSGFELAEVLRRDYKIEIEMASAGYIVAMSGMGDTPESLVRFADALLDIDRRNALFDGSGIVYPDVPPIPLSAMRICEAVSGTCEPLCAEFCIGKVSAEYIMAYPPGIPVIVPGEIFSREVVDYVSALESFGASIKSTGGMAPHKFMCFDKT